jgi:putative IMPACT (imprinted ancient) family translation regulator
MKELSSGKMIINKSFFYAYLYEVNKKDDIDIILRIHRSKYKKADHHCYALRLKNNSNITAESYKDDGEVGHPGKILLDILKKYNFEKNVLIVTRIFGGVKLGIGGVSRAFRSAGESVIRQFISSIKSN